jgi:hypothetical protein
MASFRERSEWGQTTKGPGNSSRPAAGQEVANAPQSKRSCLAIDTAAQRTGCGCRLGGLPPAAAAFASSRIGLPGTYPPPGTPTAVERRRSAPPRKRRPIRNNAARASTPHPPWRPDRRCAAAASRRCPPARACQGRPPVSGQPISIRRNARGDAPRRPRPAEPGPGERVPEAAPAVAGRSARGRGRVRPAARNRPRRRGTG